MNIRLENNYIISIGGGKDTFIKISNFDGISL